jgi:peptide/nickel transport system ATP-binding protein
MTVYLDIANLSAAFAHEPAQRVLRSINFSIAGGEVHGLVGESGAGKSMIGRAIFSILPSAVNIIEGQIVLDGRDLLTMSGHDRRFYTASRATFIPQDPQTALNPAKRIGRQMIGRLTRILRVGRAEAHRQALDLLDEVHIREPERVFRSYPHELSGGMRQRVLIAAAFLGEPKLVIADEPTTALDVTVQKQILKLIAEMQARHNTAMLFISHNLGVVAKICQTVSVIYAGKIVEQASTAALFKKPTHAYTRALLAATPRYDRPDDSLLPVPARVIDLLSHEIADSDSQWQRGRHG